MNKSFLSTLFILSVSTFLFGQTKILSWNIQDLGRSKSAEELNFMAEQMKAYDLIAIQEVVAKDPAGAQAVAKLADLLNRKGGRWDYRISDPTRSSPSRSERYAYIWRTSKVRLVGRPWLEKSVAGVIFREPYLAKFLTDSGDLLMVNYHSRVWKEKPEVEIDLMLQFNQLYPDHRILIAGDFNKHSDDVYFDKISRYGWAISPLNEKTTLKRSCKSGGYRNRPIDFFMYEAQEFRINASGVHDFVGSCENLLQARQISDHLGVWLEVE